MTFVNSSLLALEARARCGQTRERAFLTEGTATAEGLAWLKNGKVMWPNRVEGGPFKS